jgi:hypothetical protein
MTAVLLLEERARGHGRWACVAVANGWPHDTASMNGNGDASVDLSDKLELTAALLSDPQAWRHRVVEEVTITTTLHYQVWRSYQVLLPDEIVRPFLFGASGVERVRVLLPVATLPKRQLLAFHLLGPDGSPHALRRGNQPRVWKPATCCG